MKILIRQFLGKNHSWSVVGWNLAKALIDQGHQVHLFSTDGIKHLPRQLQPYLIGYTEEMQQKVIGRMPDKEYDCQISYTAMKNFPLYLVNGHKNRFGIWVWEWNGKNALPTGFAKHHHSCDYLCSPSNFGKQIFINSGIPENKVVVLPHGINVEQYSQTNNTVELSKKKFKILANIAQNHLRKNINGVLEAYGKAFNQQDDVCLILKAKEKPIQHHFDVSLTDCLKKFEQQFPRHAELRLYNEFVEDISILYRSVDAVFSLSFCEGFLFPALESIASGKLVIAPRYGGQLDFLNENNALLVDGKEVRADIRSMYWETKTNTTWFYPSIDDAVNKLRYAYNNFEKLNKSIELDRARILQEYSWSNITKQLTSLCQ